MAFELLSLDVGARGVARVTLNRPDLRNAFNRQLISEIADAFIALSATAEVRAVVLTGAGSAFSAGADLGMMREIADASPEENRAEAKALAAMLVAIDECPKPTIALINGPAIGGGVGLVAACDIALAADAAFFALSEARLGIIPAVISPFVIRAIGARQARRYFLTGERIDAGLAKAIGLVHETAPAEDLGAALDRVLAYLHACGPDAQAACKSLIACVAGRPIDNALMTETAERIAERRASAEGKHGMSAFLDKHKPFWAED